ncbi:MAG: hypothetical protein [Olavius algarvensis Gamma 1 endosymbiont]|nr:MAG: hypothetical protein [Olavius algarvensis Gamma 1 endosymbiont]
MSPERRAKGGLGCPVSHPEHGDTLKNIFHVITDLCRRYGCKDRHYSRQQRYRTDSHRYILFSYDSFVEESRVVR